MSTSPTTPRQRVAAIEAAYNAYMEAVDLHGDETSEAIMSLVLKARDEANADFDRRVEARLDVKHALGYHRDTQRIGCPTCVEEALDDLSRTIGAIRWNPDW